MVLDVWTVTSEDKARAAILAWAASPGFAAVHNGQATNEAITDHLLAFLKEAGFEIVKVRGHDGTD